MPCLSPHSQLCSWSLRPCQRLHFGVACLRVPTAVPPSRLVHRGHTRHSDLSALRQRRPGGWGGRQRRGPAGRAAACACSLLSAPLRGHTPAAPPPGRLGFESAARRCGKPGTLGRPWRARAPLRAVRCRSSVLDGNGNVSAPLGSCWRPSGATRNNWGWWPRWGSAGRWEGLRPCFPRIGSSD